ncbi:hypothetical protein K2X40_05300 [Candidatus Babeliales bacterium]|nr:hypothetical protein [Candidatus Babeliales bacterium]
MNIAKYCALAATLLANLMSGKALASDSLSACMNTNQKVTKSVYLSSGSTNSLNKKKILQKYIPSALLGKKTSATPEAAPNSPENAAQELEQELDTLPTPLQEPTSSLESAPESIAPEQTPALEQELGMATTPAINTAATTEIEQALELVPAQQVIEPVVQTPPSISTPIILEQANNQPVMAENTVLDTLLNSASINQVTEKIAKYDEGITAMKKIRKSLVRLLILQLNKNTTLNFAQEQQDIQRDLIDGTRSFYDFFNDFQKNPTPWLPRYLQDKGFLPFEFILDKEKLANLPAPATLDMQTTSSQDIIDAAIKIVQTDKASKITSLPANTNVQDQVDTLLQHALDNAIQEVATPSMQTVEKEQTVEQPTEKATIQRASQQTEPAQQAVAKAPTPQLAADISFLILDAKYSKNKMKILEFGEGPRSRFAGYDKLFGDGKIWEMFWHYTSQFNKQVWYVGPALKEKSAQNEIAFKKFNSIGGIAVTSIKDLVRHAKFPAPKEITEEHNISSYEGIVVFRHMNAGDEVANAFKKQYPHLLVLDSATGRHVNNKYLTSTLFDTKQLSDYRPQCKAYPKQYKKDLAQTIINEFGCSMMVIKPLNAFKGEGIVVTHQKDLDTHLKSILTVPQISKKTKSETPLNDIEKYWARDKNKSFIVEEYESSQPIDIKGDLYDPTMRMVFTMHYDNKKIHLTFLDGYWKLPAKPLVGDGSLNEKHISKISSSGTSSAAISSTDLNNAKLALQKALPRLYFKMMKTTKTLQNNKSLPVKPVTLLRNAAPTNTN